MLCSLPMYFFIYTAQCSAQWVFPWKINFRNPRPHESKTKSATELVRKIEIFWPHYGCRYRVFQFEITLRGKTACWSANKPGSKIKWRSNVGCWMPDDICSQLDGYQRGVQQSSFASNGSSELLSGNETDIGGQRLRRAIERLHTKIAKTTEHIRIEQKNKDGRYTSLMWRSYLARVKSSIEELSVAEIGWACRLLKFVIETNRVFARQSEKHCRTGYIWTWCALVFLP